MGRARGGTHASTAKTGGRRGEIVESMRVESYQPHGDQGQSLTGEPPDYDGLLIEFPRDMNDHEQEQARGATHYWAYKPYVSNGADTTTWLSRRHLWISASSHRSTSSDWRARDVFAELATYLNEGTPARKKDNNSRKWYGVGVIPARLILDHPGSTHPPLPQPPLEFRREGDKGPLFGLTSAHNLFQVRERS